MDVICLWIGRVFCVICAMFIASWLLERAGKDVISSWKYFVWNIRGILRDEEIIRDFMKNKKEYLLWKQGHNDVPAKED